MKREINYDEIDEKCVDLVKYFNSIGLTTRHCCQGHENDVLNTYSITFEDNVTDEVIANFVSKFTSEYGHTPFSGKFVKWCRMMSGKITSNWMYQITTKSDEVNHKFAEITLDIFKSV